ncbi:MAG TPA: SDR family NAD(P)-dependent oxidoreductase [Bacteroidales bacterium]|nr:SDR family NAD(P)-dependent oxidoreductase [Bacteroidales bacterium]
MNGIKEKYGRTALICGASEGIGAAFAEYLARQGMDLVLVARRAGILNDFATRVSTGYKVSVKTIECDLSDNNAPEFITASLGDSETGLLVYNAAVSYIGPFLDRNDDELQRAVNVNISTPLSLLRHLGKGMAERGRGAVILMSSMAGLQGSGYLSVYAATKAFNTVLSESLWFEWKSLGVDVLGCIAGATSTPGYNQSNPGKAGFLAPRVLRPEEIPRECFRYLGRQPSFITGRGNRLASFIMRHFMTRKQSVKVMGENTRKMYGL